MQRWGPPGGGAARDQGWSWEGGKKKDPVTVLPPAARAPADPGPPCQPQAFPCLVLRGVSLGRPEQGRGGGRGRFSLVDLQFSVNLEGGEGGREKGGKRERVMERQDERETEEKRIENIRDETGR